MDIKLTYASIKKFLKTNISPEELAQKVSLCGPTFDRIHLLGDTTIFEIEAITNRVDTACAFGVAREANAILNQFGISCELIGSPYTQEANLFSDLPEKFQITISDKELAPRFTAISLKNVHIAESDSETKKLLESCGERSLNNAIDITNELTLLYGAPLHIFDLDKIEDQKLVLRESKPKEKLTLLDDTTVELKGGDIVIEDASGKLIDLCGIMGGTKAKVDSQTKNILLIVPMYHPRKIRQTSLYLQKRTKAAQIYEKQPDIELCLPVLNQAIELFSTRCSAVPSGKVFDYYPEKLPSKQVDLDLVWLGNFIGVTVSRETALSILSDLGFTGKMVSYHKIRCTVPSWRHYDINIREDLAEEIARVYGYFKMPPVLPCVNLPPSEPSKLLSTELKIKKYLGAIGYSEIFNNSLISLDLITKTNQDTKQYLKLQNALSSDYEYLRINLVSSLLNNLKNNQGKTEEPINIFELSNVYLKQKDGDLPEERSTLCLVSTNNYLSLKGIIESLFKYLNTSNLNFPPLTQQNSIFQTGKTATISFQDKEIGLIGHIQPFVLANLGIDSIPVAAQIHIPALLSVILPGYKYTPASNFPSVIEEITLESEKPVGDILEKIRSADPLISDVKYLTSFQNKHSFRVTFTSHAGNLNQEIVNLVKAKII